jgi:hypothetical protein
MLSESCREWFGGAAARKNVRWFLLQGLDNNRNCGEHHHRSKRWLVLLVPMIALAGAEECRQVEVEGVQGAEVEGVPGAESVPSAERVVSESWPQ